MINAVMKVVVLFDMTGPYSFRFLREPLRGAVHWGQGQYTVRMRRAYVTLRRRNYSQYYDVTVSNYDVTVSTANQMPLLVRSL